MRIKVIWYFSGEITAGFFLLTKFVLLDPLPMIDREFLEEVQEHHNQLLDHAMKLISWFGWSNESILKVNHLVVR